MTLNELSAEAHAWAISRGWWDEGKPRSVGDLIALMHSELSEALEEYRDGHGPNETYYNYSDGKARATSLHRMNQGTEDVYDELGKPEGVPSELADVVIRIADFCGRYGIDLDEAIREKMAYNRTRPSTPTSRCAPDAKN